MRSIFDDSSPSPVDTQSSSLLDESLDVDIESSLESPFESPLDWVKLVEVDEPRSVDKDDVSVESMLDSVPVEVVEFVALLVVEFEKSDPEDVLSCVSSEDPHAAMPRAHETARTRQQSNRFDK